MSGKGFKLNLKPKKFSISVSLPGEQEKLIKARLGKVSMRGEFSS